MCGLEVPVIAIHSKESPWDLELNSVTEVRFTTNCYFLL